MNDMFKRCGMFLPKTRKEAKNDCFYFIYSDGTNLTASTMHKLICLKNVNVPAGHYDKKGNRIPFELGYPKFDNITKLFSLDDTTINIAEKPLISLPYDNPILCYEVTEKYGFLKKYADLFAKLKYKTQNVNNKCLYINNDKELVVVMSVEIKNH